MDLFSIILPIIYTLFGLGLIWFVIELVITIRKVRGEALSVISDVKPTLDNIENMVSDIKPALAKVDPLMDRVTLTVDSVNLEMIRVDEILESVTHITNTVSKTTSAIGNVTSAPADIITSVTSKIRNKISPKYASAEASFNLTDGDNGKNPIANLADVTIDAASQAIKEQHEKNEARKAHHQRIVDQINKKNDDIANTADKLSDSIIGQVSADAATYEPVADEPQAADYAEDNVADPAMIDAQSADYAEDSVTVDPALADAQAAFLPYQEEDVTAPSMGTSDWQAQADSGLDDLQVTAQDHVSSDDIQAHEDTLNAEDYFDIHQDADVVADNADAVADYADAIAGQQEYGDDGRHAYADQYADQPADATQYASTQQVQDMQQFPDDLLNRELTDEEIEALVTEEILREAMGDEAFAQQMLDDDLLAMQEFMNADPNNASPEPSNATSVNMSSIEPTTIASTTTFYISPDPNGDDNGGIPISHIRIG